MTTQVALSDAKQLYIWGDSDIKKHNKSKMSLDLRKRHWGKQKSYCTTLIWEAEKQERAPLHQRQSNRVEEGAGTRMRGESKIFNSDLRFSCTQGAGLGAMLDNWYKGAKTTRTDQGHF